jgi:hypothetical protein
MSTTARLNLPYIAPQQAQKQVTYNEAMAALDQLVQPAVTSRSLTAPPGAPAEGDAYIVAPSATGAWSGKDHRFACWLNGAWRFRIPASGWLAYVVDTAELAIFSSGAWQSFVTNGGTALAKLGIHAVADLTTRLAVAADASLFTHDGTSHRLKLDKAGAAHTASLLYQTGFSSRAELGLTGDDNLHLKVSPDGATWFETLSIDRTTGRPSLHKPVNLVSGQLGFPATAIPSADPNTLDDYEEGVWTPTISFGGASVGVTYGSPTNGRYTKIGRTVIASGTVTLTSKGSSVGAAGIGGLPFTSANDGVYASAAIGLAAGFTGVTGAVIGALPPNASRCSLNHSNNGASAGLSNSNLTNSAQLFFSLVYDT